MTISTIMINLSSASISSSAFIHQNNDEQGEMACFADGNCHPLYYGTNDPYYALKGNNNSVSAKEKESSKLPASSFPTSYNPLDLCTVYMAPSTLGEDTSLGIYTAVDLKQLDVVQFPEIAVPLLFREWGEHTPGYEGDGVLWDRYIWEGHVVQLQPYDNTLTDKSRSAFMPGVGCTINSILDGNNILSVHNSEYDTLDLHRSVDPGVGAYSPYANAETKVAVGNIAAGSELFAEYGDNWIPEIPGAQITFEKNMYEAEEFLLNTYHPFIEQNRNELTPEMMEALWNFTTKDFPIFNAALTTLPRNALWKDVDEEIQRFQSKSKNSQNIPVPKKLKESKPKPDKYKDDPEYVIKNFIRKQHKRDIDWLKTNGYCQDHIKPGRSTIKQAGRGAFASRNLPIGTVVGYSSLIHIGIHGRDIFTVQVPNLDGTTRKQYDLIINYSFGHSNSTVILTPYGGMVNFINHASERTQNKPNVRLRWPNKELIAHKPYYLHRTPTELKFTGEKIGLAFEYIALRDIHENEEIFIDYGIEWEEAWNKHVETYKPLDPENDSKYMHTSKWNETTLRTRSELETNPYPPNFETVCFQSYTTIENKSGDDNSVTYHHEWINNLRPDTTHRVFCEVLERSVDPNGKELYTVEMDIKNADDEEVEDENDATKTTIVHNVPRKGIFLTDIVFTADWFLPNTFRHEMMIPNHLMPKAWLNGPAPKPIFETTTPHVEMK